MVRLHTRSSRRRCSANSGRAMQLDFDGLGGPQELYVPIDPVPASRPKVARYGTYYSKRHQQYIKDWTTWFSYAKPCWFYLGTERLVVSLEFVCLKPRTTKRESPRHDIDNLVKLPLDCMTSSDIFWKDDVQIEYLFASKRFARQKEEPHTRIKVFWIT